MGRNRFRVLLNSLRGHLEPPGVTPGSVLITTRASVSLSATAFTADFQEFVLALHVANSADADNEAIAALEKALTVYQGELLAGYYDDWILAERSRLSELRYRALRDMVRRLTRGNAHERAVDYARQAVAEQPLDEEAHCDLIRLYMAIGQPSAALRQFEQLRRLLAQELNAEPSDVARELALEVEATLGHGIGVRQRPVRAVSLRASERGEAPAGRRHDLPVRFTRFFGREDEIRLLCDRLAPQGDCRLLTLIGPGGTGKTRLAVEAAERFQSAYRGRVFFLALAEVADPNDVGRALAAALSLTLSPETDPLSQALNVLATAPSLLVLDNLEQLLPDVAPLIACLLSEAPNLKCLATSRRAVGIDGEQEIDLGPLPLPRQGCDLDELATYPGVALFVDRARAVRADFDLTPYNAEDVRSLCHLLEGLPLAIELAAARVRVMTPGEMSRRTDQLIHWLVDVRGGKVARHRSLRATIEWSFRLLAPLERRVFSALAVFVGGFTADAAAIVGLDGQLGALDTLAILESLQAASMLTAVETPDSTTRFGMLDMLRRFGIECLERADAEKTVRTRHLRYCVDLVGNHTGELRDWTPDEVARVAPEDSNLRAALEYGIGADAGPAEQSLALDLAGRLGGYWDHQGQWGDGLHFLRRALARNDAPEHVGERMRALRSAGALAHLIGEHEAAEGYARSGLAMAQALNDPAATAACFTTLGHVAFAQGNYVDARLQTLEARRLFEQIDEPLGIARCVETLGNVAFFLGDHDAARVSLEEAVERYERAGYPLGVASTLLKLGNVLRNQGQFDAAHTRLQASLQRFREIANEQGIASALNGLGLAAAFQGDSAEATARLTEALDIFTRIGLKRGVAGCHLYLGMVALDEGELDAGSDHSRKALTLCQDLGDRRHAAACLVQLGRVAEAMGDLRAAASQMLEALEIEEDIGNLGGIANCRLYIGRLCGHQGRTAEARAHVGAALRIYAELAIPLGLAASLQEFAGMSARSGRLTTAIRLLGAAAAIHARVGADGTKIEAQRRADLSAALRESVGPVEFARLRAEGEALSTTEAIQAALSESP